MEMIIMSGAGTLTLLVAMLLDHVLPSDLRQRTGTDGDFRNSDPESMVARLKPNDLFTFDQAA